MRSEATAQLLGSASEFSKQKYFVKALAIVLGEEPI